MKNFKTKLFAAAMAAPLAMSGMSVFATEGETTVTTATTAVIKKELTVPNGVTTPKATFKFNVTAKKVNSDEATSTNMPIIGEKKVEYSANDTAPDSTTGNTKVITKSTGDIFENVTFEHAGVYVYEVSEQANTYITATNETMAYDVDTYTLNVYVTEENGSYAIKSITYGDNKEDKVTADSIAFQNTYTKKTSTIVDPEDPNFDGMVIKNTVTGDLGDKTRDFSYVVTVTSNGVKPDGATLTKYNAKGQAQATTTDSPMTLKHGEYIVAAGYPVGSTYVAYQSHDAPGYNVAATYEGTPGSASAVDKNGNATTASTAGFSGIITDKEDAITVTNTKTGDVNTGNIINNMPFLGLIAVALGGFIAYIALKRRQNA